MTPEQQRAFDDFAAALHEVAIKLDAMPMTGFVLVWQTGLAVCKVPEGWAISGLPFAHVWTERPQLAPNIANGNGIYAELVPIAEARRIALENQEVAINGLIDGFAQRAAIHARDCDAGLHSWVDCPGDRSDCEWCGEPYGDPS